MTTPKVRFEVNGYIREGVLVQTGKLPTKGTEGAAAYDIYADLGEEGRQTILAPGDVYPVHAGFRMALPKGYQAKILPRSGLGSKGLTLANTIGLIDSDYRGAVLCMMKNTGNGGLHTIKHGDRIAQMLIEQVPEVEFEEVPTLDATERGEGGFGSTGVK